MSHVQVAIIGSGPTGLTLANLLGQLGVRVALIERHASTVAAPRAVSIDDESLRTIQAAGLVEAVMRQIVPGYGLHYLAPSGHCFARVEPTGTPYGYPRRNAFQQPILEAQLRAGLERFAHVRQLYTTTLMEFVQFTDQVTLTLRDAQGEEALLTCDYMVGCDGADSQVRESLGFSLGGTTFNERWLILDLAQNPNTTRHTEVYCNPRRPCITLPGPDDTRRFEFKLLPGETDAMMLEPTMVAELMRTHGASPNAVLLRKVVYRFHARVADKWQHGRVFLAGDAAHLTPPFAQQGINSGLRDAHNLAWKLAAVLGGQLGSFLLGSYETERRDHIWQMIRLALRMGRVMAPRSALDGWLMRCFFDLLHIWPGTRDYVLQMKYRPLPRFYRGWLIPDERGQPSLIGRLIPQPEVVAEGRDASLLDDVLGPRFALMAVGRGAAARLAALVDPFWTKIGAIRVAFNDRDATEGGPIRLTTQDHGFRNALAPYGNDILLLRPDHYVAASFAPASESQIAARLVDLSVG